MSESNVTAEVTGKFVIVNGVKIHYHDIGNGPALVLLHGSGPGASGWSNYARNIEVLKHHFRVLCPDIPGFGLSDMKPREAPMPGWWAKAMVAFLDAVGEEKAHFVGNSMGGMITLKIAMEEPERIDRMILMGPGGGLPITSTFPTEGIKTLIGFYDGEGPSLSRLRGFINQFVYEPTRITEDLIEQRFAAATAPKIVDNPPMRPGPAGPPEELWRDPRLASLPHETLIIWGREDRVMPLDMSFSLLKQIPRARLLVIPKCGHWVQWEHAGEFNRQVMQFLLD